MYNDDSDMIVIYTLIVKVLKHSRIYKSNDTAVSNVSVMDKPYVHSTLGIGN